MKVSCSKTEYMCVNEREGSETVRLQGEEVKKVQEFKYLESTVQSNGEWAKEVKKRVQAGWNGWRKVSGVLCDRKISARIKGKVYRTVVRPAMLYGLETVSLKKRQESELEVAELKMLRFSFGVTRLDRIRNEFIRGTAHVGRLGDKVREARLRWFGHVQRRKSEYIGRRMLDMELPGRRQRGRPKRRPNVPEIEGCSPVNFFGVFCFLPSSVVNRQQQQAAFFLLSDALMSLVTQVSEATHGVRVQKEELRQVEPGDYVYVKVFKRKHWSQPRREGPFKLPSHMTWGKPGQSLPKKRPSQYVGAAEVGQEAQGQSEHRCNLFTLQEKTREQYGAWHLQGNIIT
ncbi:hypothetical protein QTP70_001487 [Hemibagrus guttatus]|uniref:Reverse transcriptase n=1 Tax=Hemibagrus guttatus TaxID=175788 RepID=A0AAE0QEG2_9TELE|nr:hypothetical protein QTP70_001487 [Hemibagrus guttatus]